METPTPNLADLGLKAASSASLFAGTLGKYSIWIAFALFAGLTVFAFLPENLTLRRLRNVSFVGGTLAIATAFGVLTWLFVNNQFQYGYVFNHGDTTTSLEYKVAGVWTAQEGSFLLWALTSAVFGALTLRSVGEYHKFYTGIYGSVLAILMAILINETPFNLLDNVTQNGIVYVPPRGDGMTPALQNYWVVIHPPIIFVGFGSLTVPFALAFAAMIMGKVDDWVKYVRPWSLAGLSILGLGISLGGLWAYETQGWGGFWAWDPVENVSLVPWLVLAAFIHGVIVQAATTRWIPSNLLLGGLPFLLFVYGTFLTRSGLLDNVSNHSFASMDEKARGILKGGLITLTAAFSLLWVFRGTRLKSANPRPANAGKGISREDAYTTGTVLLSLLAFVVSLGMSWPVIKAATSSGTQQRVEEALYHQVTVWMYLPLMVLMGTAPFLKWKSESLKTVLQRLYVITCVTLGLLGVGLILIKNPTFGVGLDPAATVAGPNNSKLPLIPVMLALMFVTMFVAVTNLVRAVEVGRKSKLGTGGFITHFGLAVLLGGLILSRGFEREERIFVREGSPSQAMGYEISFNRLDMKDSFDRDGRVVFDVKAPTGEKFEAKPSLYYYEQNGEIKANVWPWIRTTASHDLYLAMREPEINVWAKPLEVKPGESKTESNITVKYNEFTSNGKQGPGAKFGAKLAITYQDKTYNVEPYLEIGDQGMVPSLTRVSDDFIVSLTRFDAGSRTAFINLMFSPPIYPIQVFYKPLTSLIWVGTGIFTIGGFISAIYRRARRARAENDFVEKTEPVGPKLDGPTELPPNATGATA